MTSLFHLETNTDHLILEDGSGFLELEELHPAMSIRALLLADVKKALDAINGTGIFLNDLTVAGGGGGAQYWAGDGNVYQATPTAVLYWLQDASSDEPVGYLTRFLDVVVDIFTKDAGHGRTSAEEIEELLADVERAVLADPERSQIVPNVDTAHVQSSPFPSQEGSPSIGGTVRFRIRYQHVREEPSDSGG